MTHGGRAQARSGTKPAEDAADRSCRARNGPQLAGAISGILPPSTSVDGLDLQAGIDNGALDLQRLAGRAWGGRFDASGGADAGNGLGIAFETDGAVVIGMSVGQMDVIRFVNQCR